MQLGAKAKAIVAFGIAVTLIIFAGVLANAALSDGTKVTAQEGKLDAVLKSADAQELNVTAVALADIYGMEYVDAITICGGTPIKQMQDAGIDTDKLGLNGETVPLGVNYIALAHEDGSVDVDRFDTDKVNLCPQGGNTQIQPTGLAPFVKDAETGTWLYAG